MRYSKYSIKRLFLLIISIAFLSSCGNKKREEPSVIATTVNHVKLSDIQIKNAGIVTSKMEQKEISSILKVNGTIDVPPQNMISVSVPMGGYLKSTNLLPGQHIKKGDPIALIEGEQYIQLQQDYLTAKEKIVYLELEFNRQKELNKTQASSDKIMQQTESEFKSQQVLLSALKEKLQLVGINISKLNVNNISRSINLYSPIDGFVSKVNVNIGKYVSPTEVLFELINPSDIHLNLKVYEKDISKLFIGQKLNAFTNSQPTKKHPCEILLIGHDISPDRNTDVHCHFENYEHDLIPGTYMNAEISIKNAKAFVLPEDAIVLFENKQYAFIKVDANQFKMTEVQVGNTENGFTEVLQADKIASSEFVVKGAYSLLMSMKNKVDE
ncbi:MAG: efflux RND transporter periplasmic adaptor subunit [Bacteroidota bacterium]